MFRTKKITLTPQKYFGIAMKYRLVSAWWTYVVLAFSLCLSLYFKKIWIGVLGSTLVFLYFGFFALQFFGVRFMEQGKIMFAPTSYEFGVDLFTGMISSKEGYKIKWSQVKKIVSYKNYDLLVLSLGHFIYLPYNAFTSDHHISFVRQFFKKEKK